MSMLSIVDDLPSVVDALRVDVGSRMLFPRVAVFRPDQGIWVFDTDSGAARPSVDGFDFSAPWIAAIGGDVFTVETDAVPGLVVELASRLQDIVMDTTGRGWPEIYRDGRFVGLAQPTTRGDGDVGWGVSGLPLIPFGSMPASPAGVPS